MVFTAGRVEHRLFFLREFSEKKPGWNCLHTACRLVFGLTEMSESNVKVFDVFDLAFDRQRSFVSRLQAQVPDGPFFIMQ